jgi:prepilin-type N-terminal cleavage/methylation domain-containing protein
MALRMLFYPGMMKDIHKSRNGFTLVEIMIVVAIIALLAAIAVPNFLRARKRSQATRVLEDLRMLDAAVDQYAIETGKTSACNPLFADLKGYIKAGTALYTTGGDMFGNSYGPFTVDSVPKVPDPTFNALSDVADASFWSPYK